MICPACKAQETRLEKSGYYTCLRCGAREEEMEGVDGTIWRLQSGRIVAAPLEARKQFEKAKKEWDTGDWDKAEKKL